MQSLVILTFTLIQIKSGEFSIYLSVFLSFYFSLFFRNSFPSNLAFEDRRITEAESSSEDTEAVEVGVIAVSLLRDP